MSTGVFVLLVVLLMPYYRRVHDAHAEPEAVRVAEAETVGQVRTFDDATLLAGEAAALEAEALRLAGAAASLEAETAARFERASSRATARSKAAATSRPRSSTSST